jgi:peptidoglycan/xylan/chitin deacetylase (PgdA/CDA1 family)
MIAKRELAATLLDRAPVRPALKLAPAWSGILVLNYHRIGDPAATPFDRDVFSATEEAFDRQCRFLARELDVIGLDELDDALARRTGRFAMITFDDGYRDNFALALPILRAHRLPATFFVATSFIDAPHIAWWDEIAWMVRHATALALPPGLWSSQPLSLAPADADTTIRALLRCYKGRPAMEAISLLDHTAHLTGAGRFDGDAAEIWMTWDMVRELHARGVAIGGHTVSHQLLSRLPVARQAAEIAGSRDRIAREIGTAPSGFAYPVGKPGAFTADAKRLLAEHGFRAAFAFNGGYQTFDAVDRYEIPRAHVGHTMSDAAFRALVRLPRFFAG